MGIKRSECSDAEWGAKLVKAYDAAAATAENGSDPNHPRHAVNAWLALARGEPAEDDGTEGDTPIAGGGPGATDSRRWRNASAPVKAALDAAMVRGRSASDSLALAEASLRHQGANDSLFFELRSYHAAATTSRNAARATQALDGYSRLR
jgi:hypothetical protein